MDFGRGTPDQSSHRDADVHAAVQDAVNRVASLIPGDMLLRPPATVADLTIAETHLGQSLPEAVRALYLLHDGQHRYTAQDPRWAAGLFAEVPLLPLAEVLAQRDMWAGLEDEPDLDESATSTPDGYVLEKYSTRGWIPLTEDGGGNHIGIDLNPGPAGAVGQVIMFGRDDDEHRVLAPSLLSYLEQLGDLLERGHGEAAEGGDGWNLRGSNGYLDHTLFDPAGTAN